MNAQQMQMLYAQMAQREMATPIAQQLARMRPQAKLTAQQVGSSRQAAARPPSLVMPQQMSGQRKHGLGTDSGSMPPRAARSSGPEDGQPKTHQESSRPDPALSLPKENPGYPDHEWEKMKRYQAWLKHLRDTRLIPADRNDEYAWIFGEAGARRDEMLTKYKDENWKSNPYIIEWMKKNPSMEVVDWNDLITNKATYKDPGKTFIVNLPRPWENGSFFAKGTVKELQEKLDKNLWYGPTYQKPVARPGDVGKSDAFRDAYNKEYNRLPIKNLEPGFPYGGRESAWQMGDFAESKRDHQVHSAGYGYDEAAFYALPKAEQDRLLNPPPPTTTPEEFERIKNDTRRAMEQSDPWRAAATNWDAWGKPTKEELADLGKASSYHVFSNAGPLAGRPDRGLGGGPQFIPVSGPTQDWNGPKGTSRNFWQWGQGEDGKAEVWWKPEFAPKELRYSYEKIRPDNWEEILNKNAPVVDRSSMTPADLAAEGSHAAAGSPRGVYSGTPNSWASMNTATGRFETPIQPFGYTDQSGRYIGPYQQGYGNYVAPMLEPQSVNATPYTA